ncbi:hypothetical protein [Methanogenium organophilum]|uniref:Uncharacterized protein n=1 Tax=Methanogenium organophilum TaxID=2199 RepID=A0A9X9T7B3_METOG|nr:hypothetical protein [Methanogenium organophilum]WAI00879.1 hypothetical protein OU421_10720 [Methanogenium organophilum]
MKLLPGMLCLLVLLAMVMPAAAASPNQYSYITVEGCTIHLNDEDAVIDLDYSIDEGIVFLVHLLGKSDLKRKLGVITGYPDARYQTIDMDHATILVNDVSQNYGEGSYWFPAHTFGVEIPELILVSPQVNRTFNMSQSVEGMGYFGTKG